MITSYVSPEISSSLRPSFTATSSRGSSRGFSFNALKYGEASRMAGSISITRIWSTGWVSTDRTVTPVP